MFSASVKWDKGVVSAWHVEAPTFIGVCISNKGCMSGCERYQGVGSGRQKTEFPLKPEVVREGFLEE